MVVVRDAMALLLACRALVCLSRPARSARSATQPTTVARPLPRRTASIAPGSRIENTMIGILFSRASAKAVASMTFRSRSIASWWRDAVVALGLRVLLRVGAVDAVHVGGLEHRVAIHLGGAQHRGGVGGEERIAGAAGEHHDAVLPRDGAARAGARRSRRPAACRAPTWCAPARRAARSRLRAPGVHHGRQHAHRVGGRPRQPLAGHFDAAEDVAAADHHAERDAERARATRSLAMRSMVGWWMPKPFGPDKRFARYLDDHAAVGRAQLHVVLAILPAADRRERRPADVRQA